MPTEPALVVPRAERDVPTMAMHLTASGDDAEASMRQMCRGAMPVVGQRYVWVCTGVTNEDGRVQAAFQLMPLDPTP